MIPLTTSRIDKYLWAARFYKTRQLAIDAINAGRVEVNGERVKPARMVKLGEVVLVRKPPYESTIIIMLLSEKRGSASVAITLYRETDVSLLAREALKKELKDLPPPLFAGRPTKKDRRTLERFFDHQQTRSSEPD